jgi:serine/threonine-protein kinase
MDPATAGILAGMHPRIVKYDLLAELGRGGMATVYRALDRRLGREVAIKVIHPHLRDSREVAARFETEARAVAKLRHPNIVEVYDVSDAGEEELYLVVELLAGTTLRTILQRRAVLPPEIAAALGMELLGALAHAHAGGVIHRDIKPENVLVELRPPRTDDASGSDVVGSRAVVKLTDFGIAKLLDAQGITSTGQVLGSPAHMAPEQIEGAEVDGRADIFAVGVLLYECMVGNLPFDGNNPAQVLRRVLEASYREAQSARPSVGSRWSAILARALARKPEDRFSHATEMREALSSELSRLGIASPRSELEAWLADPEAYEQSLKTSLRGTLCALGTSATVSRDYLGAAADFNRALALFPADPQLLRIVARMNRSRARARALRRASSGALAMTIVVGATAGIVRLWKRAHMATHDAPTTDTASATVQSAPVLDMTAAAPSPIASATATRPASLPSQRGTRSVAAPPPPRMREGDPNGIERTLTLDLQPSVGVTVAIDTGPPLDVHSGATLTLDGLAHALTFTCPVCEPMNVSLRASDKSETLHVVVPVRPATLVIAGEPESAYQIVEMPEIAVRAGNNTIPVLSMFRVVTVRQIETHEERRIRVKAGDVARVSF